MKNFKFLTVISLLVFAVYGCSSVSDADVVGDEFYGYVKTQQFEKIGTLLHARALQATPLETWIAGIENVTTEMGALKSYKRTSFGTSFKNEIRQTTLRYTNQYERGTLYEKIIFFDSGDGFKIQAYRFSKNEDDLKDPKKDKKGKHKK